MDEKQQRTPGPRLVPHGSEEKEKERKSLAALIASDLRKEMARLIGSGLRKASEGAITKFEREMRTQMQVAASYERGIVASMVRGVLDEIGVDHNYAAQIEKHIKLGQFSE